MSQSLDSTASPARATLGAATPILRVENLNVSIAYYVERLGFEVEWRAGSMASVRTPPGVVHAL